MNIFNLTIETKKYMCEVYNETINCKYIPEKVESVMIVIILSIFVVAFLVAISIILFDVIRQCIRERKATLERLTKLELLQLEDKIL
jgi:hypothetical protein